MLAKDLMTTDIYKIRADETVETLIELMVREHLHGVPVVDEDDQLVGIVTQQDVFFSAMSREPGAKGRGGGLEFDTTIPVREIMTSPAVSAEEGADVQRICTMMDRLRIHRIPVVRDGKLTGILGSLDVCAAVARGDFGE